MIDERTNWRDEALSARHRTWGFHIPMFDVDFLCVEYSKRKPVALIEYKHERGWLVSRGNANMDVLISLGDNHTPALPVFVVQYAAKLDQFTVIPMNAVAEGLVSAQTVMNELQYVEFLYSLRRSTVPPVIRDEICKRQYSRQVTF
jgi:hypothetical protein